MPTDLNVIFGCVASKFDWRRMTWKWLSWAVLVSKMKRSPITAKKTQTKAIKTSAWRLMFSHFLPSPSQWGVAVFDPLKGNWITIVFKLEKWSDKLLLANIIFDENCGFSKPLFTKMAWCLFDGLFDAGTFQTTAKMVRSSNSHAIS